MMYTVLVLFMLSRLFPNPNDMETKRYNPGMYCSPAIIQMIEDEGLAALPVGSLGAALPSYQMTVLPYPASRQHLQYLQYIGASYCLTVSLFELVLNGHLPTLILFTELDTEAAV